MACSGVNYP